MRISFRFRLFVLLMLVSVGGIGLVYGLLSARFSSLAERSNREQTRMEADHYAGEFSALLQGTMSRVRSVSRFLSGTGVSRASQDLAYFDRIAPTIVEDQTGISNLWLALDQRYVDPYSVSGEGLHLISWRMVRGRAVRNAQFTDSGRAAYPRRYVEIRNANRELTVGPYRLSGVGDGHDSDRVTLCAPIRDVQGAPAGIVCGDLLVSQLVEMSGEMRPYAHSQALLITGEGRIAAAPIPAIVGQPADQVLSNVPRELNLIDRLRDEESFSLTYESSSTHEWYHLYRVPIRIGQERAPWSMVLIVSADSLRGTSTQFAGMGLVLFLVAGLLITLFLWWLTGRIFNPVREIHETVDQLSYGRVNDTEPMRITGGLEFRSLRSSVNRLRESLREKVRIADALGQGHYSIPIEVSEEDVLGGSLLRMRENLLEAEHRDQEQDRQEQEQRWVTQGIARFGEILRVGQHDIDGFAYRFIQELAVYTGSSVAALYLQRKEDALGDETGSRGPVYVLSAAYAYEVRKYQQREFAYHEGLVGQCAAERELIHLTDLPEDYITIASGLGHSKPDALIVVPGFQNDDLVVILEMARYGDYAEYEIEFIRRVLNSLAVTLEGLYSNLQSQQLVARARQQGARVEQLERDLDESQNRFEELQLQALHESSRLQELQMALDKACGLVEYDAQGRVLWANNAYLTMVRLSMGDLVGRLHSEGLEFTAQEKSLYESFWEDLRHGMTKRNVRTRCRLAGGQLIELIETYVPVTDSYSHEQRIIKISIDPSVLAAGSVSASGE